MSAAARILFAKEKDDELPLCVDYWALNTATVSNRYPLPLSPETLNRFCRSQIFSKLDLRNIYHIIQFKEGDKNKLRSGLWMGSSITESYHLRKWMHQLLSKPLSITAYILTFAASVCATLMIYWSTPPMRRSTESRYEKCWNNYKHMVFMAQPKCAVSGSHWSAFSDASFVVIALRWHRTAYQQLKTGIPQKRFESCRWFFDSWTFTGGSSGNMQR